MIEVGEVRKVYGDVVAVDGVTFSVESGEVFGLVGPNGAGKTTTLKLLAGLLDPTGGTARIGGTDPTAREVHHRLGFLPEESPLYDEMTARSYLAFFADLYDVPSDIARNRIDDALDRLELDARDRPLGDLSRGMTRKVAIARSLVNDPDVLVYDEPASGLDPITTNAIIDLIRELAAAGKSVVFSAHDLHHVESVCDRVAIMNEGQIVARGTITDLRERYGHTEYRVVTDVPVDGSVDVEEGHLTVVATMDEVEELRRMATGKGGGVVDIRTVEPSLERLFLDIAGGGSIPGDTHPGLAEKSNTRHRGGPEADR